MRKKKHRILRERAGTTLVETLVSLLLMSILIGMAARVLSGAYRCICSCRRPSTRSPFWIQP